jgi:hypothetical protein
VVPVAERVRRARDDDHDERRDEQPVEPIRHTPQIVAA